MVYAPLGFARTEIGDIEVIADGDTLHLYHLTLPNHDLVGHARSEDGIHWQPLPPVMRTGDPGAVDDDMIWTMGIASDHGRHTMLYTALDRASHGRVQRTALAQSDDLHTWTKHPGAAAQADSAFYEVHSGPWVSWRDPKPVRVGDEWLAVVCARDVTAPWLRRGCVGLMRSSDMVHWRVEGPLFSPRRFFDVECPQLLEIDGSWALIASVLDDRSVRYWLADAPRGPFSTPRDNVLIPPGVYAARVVYFQGEHLLFAVHEDERGPNLDKAMSTPLVVRRSGDQLFCAPYTPVGLRSGTPKSLPVDALRARLANPTAAELTVREGAELWTLDGPHHSFVLELELAVSAAAWGVCFGLDEDLCGYFVELEAGRARLLRNARAESDGHPWFERTSLQEVGFAAPAKGRYRLRVGWGEVELSVDGRVILFRALTARPGDVGLFAECGRLELVEVSFETTPPPTV